MLLGRTWTKPLAECRSSNVCKYLFSAEAKSIPCRQSPFMLKSVDKPAIIIFSGKPDKLLDETAFNHCFENRTGWSRSCG